MPVHKHKKVRMQACSSKYSCSSHLRFCTHWITSFWKKSDESGQWKKKKESHNSTVNIKKKNFFFRGEEDLKKKNSCCFDRKKTTTRVFIRDINCYQISDIRISDINWYPDINDPGILTIPLLLLGSRWRVELRIVQYRYDVYILVLLGKYRF